MGYLCFTANTIGSGKTNSATCVTALGDISDTIWYFIKKYNER